MSALRAGAALVVLGAVLLAAAAVGGPAGTAAGAAAAGLVASGLLAVALVRPVPREPRRWPGGEVSPPRPGR